MENDINNIETAESERLLSGNVVKAHIYGAKEPVCLPFEQNHWTF